MRRAGGHQNAVAGIPAPAQPRNTTVLIPPRDLRQMHARQRVPGGVSGTARRVGSCPIPPLPPAAPPPDRLPRHARAASGHKGPRMPASRPAAISGACQSPVMNRLTSRTAQTTAPRTGTKTGTSNPPVGSPGRSFRITRALLTMVKTSSRSSTVAEANCVMSPISARARDQRQQHQHRHMGRPPGRVDLPQEARQQSLLGHAIGQPVRR